MTTRGFLALLLTATAFSACSGGGSNAVAPAHRTASGGKTAATFTIKWTNPTASAAVRRKSTISPAAQSVIVVINGTQAAEANRGLSPTQTIPLIAPVGNDQFVFNVYDQPNGLGHLLGSANVQQLIVDGAANTVSAAIDAVCAVTNVGGQFGNPLLSATTAVSGVYKPSITSIVLAGQASEVLTVNPEDVDGNVIVAGSTGTVSFSITGGDTVQAVDGSHIRISPTGFQPTLTSPPQTLTIAAPGCPSVTIAVSHSPAIYAQASDNVRVSDVFGDSLNIGFPASGDIIIGYDTSLREMIAYNDASGAVNAYDVGLGSHTTLYTIHPFSIVTWSNYLHGVFAWYGPTATFYTFRSSAFVTINAGTAASANITALTASTWSTDANAYATDGSHTYGFSLQTLTQTTMVTTGNTVKSLAYNAEFTDVFLFFGIPPYVADYNNVLSASALPSVAFNSSPKYGAIDTDFGDVFAVESNGRLEASDLIGNLLSGTGLTGTPEGLTVVSENEH